jgi:hypothetical protein
VPLTSGEIVAGGGSMMVPGVAISTGLSKMMSIHARRCLSTCTSKTPIDGRAVWR